MKDKLWLTAWFILALAIVVAMHFLGWVKLEGRWGILEAIVGIFVGVGVQVLGYYLLIVRQRRK